MLRIVQKITTPRNTLKWTYWSFIFILCYLLASFKVSLPPPHTHPTTSCRLFVCKHCMTLGSLHPHNPPPHTQFIVWLFIFKVTRQKLKYNASYSYFYNFIILEIKMTRISNIVPFYPCLYKKQNLKKATTNPAFFHCTVSAELDADVLG